MRTTVVTYFVVIAVFVALPVAVYGQDTAVSGTVVDTTGAVLPGATIVAVHEASGNTFEGVTDGHGAFRLLVRPGTYRITAELVGFGKVTRSGLELLVGQIATVNLQLSPSTVQESVTVTGEAPLIDTSTSSLGSNIDHRQLQQLPVNGRNWMDLTMLAAGSRVNAVSEIPTATSGTTVKFELNVDGQRITNLMAVDFGQPRYSRDAMAEFEFISNRFDASQGHSSGVQVNAVTKSGTNTFSGLFSGYFRSDRFNAADPVAKVVLPYSNQQISTTFGGPIQRDRFHFFGSYEYEREPSTFVYTTPYPYFNGSLTGTRLERKGLGRLDYQFSPQTRLSIRGSKYDNMVPYDPRYTGGSDRTMASAIGTHRRSEALLGSLTRVLGARAVNEVKLSYSLFHWNQFSHTRNPNALRGMTPGLGAPVINLRGFTLGQSHQLTPQDIATRDLSVRDDLGYSFSKHGRHDLKAGGEYIYNFLFETVCSPGCMGQYDLQGGPIPANIDWASLMPDVRDVGTWNLDPLSYLARQYQRGIAMVKSPYSRPSGNWGYTQYAPRHEMATWVQDDWQVSPSLTLNLGLRYDFSFNQFVNWVVFPPFLMAPRPQDKDNIAPRLGFAYKLGDRTVLRGGWGKYYAEVTSQQSFTLRTVQTIQPQVLYDGRPNFISDPFNGPAPTYEEAQLRLCAVNDVPGCLRPNMNNIQSVDQQQPYSYQSSIGFQQQLGTEMSFEADYVFQADRATTRTANTNIAFDPATGVNYRFTGAGANVTKRQMPAYGEINLQRTDGRTNNHALLASFTKRMSHGWQASATYTLQGDWQFDNYTLSPGCQYPWTIAGTERARCDVPVTLAPDISENKWYLTGAQRHRITFNGIWQLPYEFQLSGMYLFGDNGKATPSSGVDTRGIGSSGGRRRADGSLIERNSFDRWAIHRTDMRIQRRFKLGGKASVEGIFEVFNVINRANFNSWVLNQSNARYGQVQQDTNLAYAPRMLQLGFRATF